MTSSAEVGCKPACSLAAPCDDTLKQRPSQEQNYQQQQQALHPLTCALSGIPIIYPADEPVGSCYSRDSSERPASPQLPYMAGSSCTNLLAAAAAAVADVVNDVAAAGNSLCLAPLAAVSNDAEVDGCLNYSEDGFSLPADSDTDCQCHSSGGTSAEEAAAATTVRALKMQALLRQQGYDSSSGSSPAGTPVSSSKAAQQAAALLLLPGSAVHSSGCRRPTDTRHLLAAHTPGSASHPAPAGTPAAHDNGNANSSSGMVVAPSITPARSGHNTAATVQLKLELAAAQNMCSQRGDIIMQLQAELQEARAALACAAAAQAQQVSQIGCLQELLTAAGERETAAKQREAALQEELAASNAKQAALKDELAAARRDVSRRILAVSDMAGRLATRRAEVAKLHAQLRQAGEIVHALRSLRGREMVDAMGSAAAAAAAARTVTLGQQQQQQQQQLQQQQLQQQQRQAQAAASGEPLDDSAAVGMKRPREPLQSIPSSSPASGLPQPDSQQQQNQDAEQHPQQQVAPKRTRLYSDLGHMPEEDVRHLLVLARAELNRRQALIHRLQAASSHMAAQLADARAALGRSRVSATPVAVSATVGAACGALAAARWPCGADAGAATAAVEDEGALLCDETL